MASAKALFPNKVAFIDTGGWDWNRSFWGLGQGRDALSLSTESNLPRHFRDKKKSQLEKNNKIEQNNE